MAWVQIRFAIKSEYVDDISDLLMELGCLSVTFTANDPDEAVFELFPGDVKYWKASTVVGLFDATTEMQHIAGVLAEQEMFEGQFSHTVEYRHRP